MSDDLSDYKQAAEVESQLRREFSELAERYQQALQSILAWSEAYPTDVFPKPDLVKARALLEAGGITLDAISAHCMRHAVDGVGRIAKDALAAMTLREHVALLAKRGTLDLPTGHDQSGAYQRLIADEDMPKFICDEATPWSPEQTVGINPVMILHPQARFGDDGVRECPICRFRWDDEESAK